VENNVPLVSICMSAYNAGDYIAEAVNSIINQSYQNWELIIVNDGSTDDTASQITAFSDCRIRSYDQDNKGQCAAANKAFSLSKGDLIKFMDADDLISPDFIRNQVGRLNGRDDLIAYAAWGRFYHNDLNTFILNENYLINDLAPIDWLVTAIGQKSAMMQCALWLIPRNILIKAGPWDETLSLINDLEFFIRVLLQAKIIRFTKNAVLYYRSGLHNSLSALKSRVGAQSAYRSIEKGMSYILQHENSVRTRKIAADCYQNFIYSYYPDHPDLIALAEKKVNELGGSSARFPAGGYTLWLQKILGWKLTVKTRKLLKQLR
jgi:glycosyltransferase involved in cell wall biosynthesis